MLREKVDATVKDESRRSGAEPHFGRRLPQNEQLCWLDGGLATRSSRNAQHSRMKTYSDAFTRSVSDCSSSNNSDEHLRRQPS